MKHYETKESEHGTMFAFILEIGDVYSVHRSFDGGGKVALLRMTYWMYGVVPRSFDYAQDDIYFVDLSIFIKKFIQLFRIRAGGWGCLLNSFRFLLGATTSLAQYDIVLL